MKIFFIVSCVFMLLKEISGENVIVQIKHGKLLGQRVKTVTGVVFNSFKGIPYAKPPVGKLRFKAPQEPEPWDGERNATVHGSICPQMDLLKNVYIPGNEDCLFLNVYTPNLKPEKPLPVIVVIHGGAYTFGSGNDDLYGPDFLVHAAVVVTFNFRLGILGFLSLGTCEVPGNAGLKDQVAVLKWVQENIHNFGGDAKSVTLLGSTTGGVSVTYHLISPVSKGLFRRGISMSGTLLNDAAYPYQPELRALEQAKSLGYQGKTSNELLEFLQNATPERLINTTFASAAIFPGEEKTLIPFKILPFTAPVAEKQCPEGNFLTKDPFELLKSGKVNNADVMFSYNNKEALLLVDAYATIYLKDYARYPALFSSSKILINAKPDTVIRVSDKIVKHYFGEKNVSVANMAEFITYATDDSIAFDVQRFYRRWPKVGKKYVFKFESYTKRNYYGSQGAKYGTEGASHFDDICYIFDPKSLNLPLNLDGVEYKIIKKLTDSLINFAKYGQPTQNASIWPQYSAACPVTAVFKDDITLHRAVDDDMYKFWESIFGEAEVEF